MRVLKFGGAALRDGTAIEHALDLVEHYAGQGRVLLVVSAQEGVTAQLERAAEEASLGRLEAWDALRVRHHSALAQLGLPSELLDRLLRELRALLEELRLLGRCEGKQRDYVLSYGERMSARIVAAVLRRRGHEAVPLDAYDLGLTTAARRGGSELLEAPTESLRKTLLAVRGIPVVTGFLALDPSGDLTTLGPNGSDLSAVWFGEAVAAEEVILWKEVEGFMSADPDFVPGARRISELGRSEAVEFAVHGADVLHAGALEPAERSGLVVRIADVRDPDEPGSRIEATTPSAGPLGLAQRAGLVRYREPIALGRDQAAQFSALAQALHDAGLEPYRLAASGRELELLVVDHPRLASFAAARPRAQLERGWASFAVVGRGVAGERELGERVRALAAQVGAVLEPAPGACAGDGGSSQVFLTRAVHLRAALAAVHAGLFPERPGEILPRPRPGAGRAAERELPR
jgi:aspartokinase